MKLKIDENGHVVVTDGKPVYVKDDGSEVAFDVTGTVATIARLNSEAKGHREAKEAAEASLKAFEGIDDPAAARKALEITANLDAKKLVDAGEVQRVKDEVTKAIEAKYAPVVEERDRLNNDLVKEKIGGAFTRSKFIADKLAIPADMVEARFGQSFKVEDGKVVAYDNNGNKIFSPSNPGELASFDEALDVMVGSYPHRDSILKGSGASGSGAGGSGAKGGVKSYTRSQFDALDPAAKVAVAREASAGTASISD